MHNRLNALVLLATFALVGVLEGCAMPLRDRAHLACMSARELFPGEARHPRDEAIGVAPRSTPSWRGTAMVKTRQRLSSTARVVLMTPDIELFELSAGGVLKP